MPQKVLKVGSSAAVTIAKSSLEELGLQIGDTVEVSLDVRHRNVTITPLRHPRRAVDPEIVRWTKSFIDRYRPALEALARK
jgi:antitoxin component of MazEF toxin-antitoxin module